MKRFGSLTVLMVSLSLLMGTLAVAVAADLKSTQAALDRLSTDFPQTRLYWQEDRLTCAYGHSFGSGASPEDAADQFIQGYSQMFGVETGDLRPESFLFDKRHTQPLMYLKDSNSYKFTLVYYSQYRDGIPVYMADIRLLVRNERGYPLVLASSALRNLGDFTVDPSVASIDPLSVQQSFRAQAPGLTNFSQPRMVIWAGIDNMTVSPALGVEFIGDNGTPATERQQFIVDPVTFKVLYQENLIIDIDVTGQVNSLATENFKAEQCGNEVTTPMAAARVNIVGGNSAYTDSTGHFVIPNAGSTPVTVQSTMRGHWFWVYDNAVSDTTISHTVTPPGPVTFLHNPLNTEYRRAETNAYLHANTVRNYTLKYNPSYPVIAAQTEFPVRVNRNDLYCPGNAWYDGSSINFCRAGSGYPNTAFSTIIHHEYGHHLVEVAGSGQEEYGEGMGDVMGLLITDDHLAAVGFYGDCVEGLRDAENTMQYPCSGEIHYCGQLLSGCVWSTRNALLATNPFDYRDILSDLAINAILLHQGYTITPQITIHYLTIDDDDDNLDNGTPHHAQICTGFGAHNMDCPPLILLAFNYPNGRPEYVSPSGGTTMRVEVTGVAGTPRPSSGLLHYRTGTTWSIASMTEITPNVYDAVFPAFACGTAIQYYVSAMTSQNETVNDPENAPTGYYTTTSGTGSVIIYQDDFSANLGWTGTGGLGEWTLGVCTGGSGSDTHGHADPSTDHSPTSDNRVLGNDLTGGTGGDYSPSLGSTYWVTSPAINCSGRSGVQLSFWRWLGVERSQYDHAYLQGYNGSSWVTIWQNDTITVDETAWSQKSYSVGSIANNNANFRVRFGIGITDGAWQYCGWNIDDLKIAAVACDTVAMGTLAGTVTDAQGNVANVRVHAFDGSGHDGYDTTAINGTYSFAVPAGTYSVSFTHVDHRDTTVANVTVISGNTTTLNVVMQRLPGVVRGTVRTQPGSNPIADVRVIALGSGREDTTGVNGTYIIDGLTDGNYTISFTHPEYRDTTRAAAVTPGDTTVVDVGMTARPGWIAGTVRDSVGAPIESVFVRINSAGLLLTDPGKPISGITPAETAASDGGDPPLILVVDSVYTNASGYYSSHVPTGNYSVRFTKNDYRDTTIAGVAVTPNDTTLVSPTLKRYNHPPIITSPSTATATEHQLFRYVATASDSDGVIPAITYGAHPAWTTISDDTLSGTPPEGSTNTSFTVFASDGYLADTLVVSLTVISVNDPPVITSPDTATAIEHAVFTYTATATDPDGPSLSFNFLHYASWLSRYGSSMAGIPPEGAQDTSLTVIATDGTLSDTLIVSVQVIPVNDPPVITSPANATAIEDQPFRYIAMATDPDGPSLTLGFSNYASWLTVQGDTIFGTPADGQPDTTFNVIASDGMLADTLLVSVTINALNHPPVITSPDTATAVEDILFKYVATALDPDGNLPAMSFIHRPGWMIVVADTISGIPLEGFVDTVFTVIASDGSLADTEVVSVHVILVNEAPYITSPEAADAVPGQPFGYIATAVDPDGTIPGISFENYPYWMSVTGSTIHGQTPMDASDTSFVVLASDGELSDTLLVRVTVAPACVYVLGDVGGSGIFNGIDITYMVAFFKGGPPPTVECICPPHGSLYVQGDINASCSFNGVDVSYGVTYFKGGPPPMPCPDCPPQGGPAVTSQRKGKTLTITSESNAELK